MTLGPLLLFAAQDGVFDFNSLAFLMTQELCHIGFTASGELMDSGSPEKGNAWSD